MALDALFQTIHRHRNPQRSRGSRPATADGRSAGIAVGARGPPPRRRHSGGTALGCAASLVLACLSPERTSDSRRHRPGGPRRRHEWRSGGGSRSRTAWPGRRRPHPRSPRAMLAPRVGRRECPRRRRSGAALRAGNRSCGQAQSGQPTGTTHAAGGMMRPKRPAEPQLPRHSQITFQQLRVG